MVTGPQPETPTPPGTSGRIVADVRCCDDPVRRPRPARCARRRRCQHRGRRGPRRRSRPRRRPVRRCCPEYLQYRGSDEGFRASARPIPGPHTEPFSEVARRHGAWILVGSTAETSPDPARPYNTSALIAPDGSVAAVYRKVHLFDVAVEAGPVDTESARVTAGDRLVTADVDGAGRGAVDLLRPALPRALPGACPGRRPGPDRPVSLHGADRSRPLGGAPSRARDRERGLRPRAVADRRTTRPDGLRATRS